MTDLVVLVLTMAFSFAGALLVRRTFESPGPLAAAAVSRPVLRAVQGLVDRRLNREEYDAQLAVESFADRLREEVDPQEVLAGLLSVVDRTVAPAEVGLWVRDGER